MILDRYLFKEILKVQLVSLVVLLSVFLCQSLIKFLGRAAVGRVPVDLIWSMVLYSIPAIAYIMLPLTMFMGILLAVGRISSDSEMVVMRSVGYSTWKLMRIALLLGVFTAAAAGINSLWFMPEAYRLSHELTRNAENNPQYLPIESGRFVNFSGDTSYSIYIDKVEEQDGDDKSLGNVYVIADPFSPAQGFFSTSQSALLNHDESGRQWLRLSRGERVEGPDSKGRFRVFSFGTLDIPVSFSEQEGSRYENESGLGTRQLWEQRGQVKSALELQWRLMPLFSCLILSMIAVPLSLVNPRQGRFAKLGPAVMIYVAYLLMQLSLRNLINTGSIGPWPGLFLVPALFLLAVALPLNLRRDLRRLRARESGKAKKGEDGHAEH